jgi:AbrB family looped-hinge helix DNA binding protein
MDIATVSPGYKIYIPRPVREALGIRPGEQVQVACDGDQIRVVPLREHEAAASTR